MILSIRTFHIHHILNSFDSPYRAVNIESNSNEIKQNDETVNDVRGHNEEIPSLLYHEYHKLPDGNDYNDEANDFCN